jgi:hypothetical protein
MRAYDQGRAGLEWALDATTKYAEVLLMDVDPDAKPVSEKKRIELRRRYRDTLEQMPWKSCGCAICSKISVEVAIFRSSNRNKRRGIHNLHVYYNHIKTTEGVVNSEQASLLCS